MSTVELTAVPASAVSPTAEQVVEAVYRFADQKLQSGASYSKIKRALIEEQGLDGIAAETVVTNLKKARSQALRAAGPKNMLAGALWCIGGAVVTAATYQMASGPEGGHYVVAWGAIFFGALQFFNGLCQT